MQRWLKWILAITVAVLIVLLMHQFAFTSSTISSSEMEPTLYAGDRVIVNKWSYGYRATFLSYSPYKRWNESPVEKGDMVLFNNPFSLNQSVIDKREICINRCIGIPGDTLIVDSLFTILSKKEIDSHFPLVIPGKGLTVEINPWNIILLRNTIVLHENKLASIINGKLYLGGKLLNSYTFTQDYYWMMSHNSADSRFFGFVPHSYLIGKASFIWFSKDPDKNILNGYRWNRFFRSLY